MTDSQIEKIVRTVAAEFGLSSRTWLSLQECAHYLGYSEPHLSALVRTGKAPASVLISARARRFNRVDVELSYR